MTRTLAIIPARAGSKRILNKNRRDFLGKPLILWTVEFALSVDFFDHIFVSTDSTEIADIAIAAGASCPWLRQPILSSDTATSVDVVLDVLSRLEHSGDHYDRVALLQPTSPVRLRKRWIEARLIMDQGAPAVVGMRPAVDHPYWTYFPDANGSLVPYLDLNNSFRSQDLPTALVPSGSLYLINTDLLKSTRSFVSRKSHYVLCPDLVESIDIDTETDWIKAESIISSLRG